METGRRSGLHGMRVWGCYPQRGPGAEPLALPSYTTRGNQSDVILIGQYDSPFVRRVAVALRLYGIDYEHRPWSVFSDADRVRDYNPLCRVPTLVLPGGIALPESGAILDYLDQQAATAPWCPGRVRNERWRCGAPRSPPESPKRRWR